MELVRNIAAVIGLIAAFLGLVTTLTNKGREAVGRFFSKNTKDLSVMMEEQMASLNDIYKKLDNMEDCQKTLQGTYETFERATKIQLRTIIVSCYHEHIGDKTIPMYKRKVVDQAHDIYHEYYHENSFTTSLYEEIKTWEIT